MQVRILHREQNLKTKIMESHKYKIRKTTVSGSNALIVYKGTETVMYIKPYDLETSKLADLIDVIVNFLNRNNDSNQTKT